MFKNTHTIKKCVLIYNNLYSKIESVIKMNLNQLKFFLEVAVSENITKTAQQHLLPPSAVSSSIKKLEQELGVELFDRTHNKITINTKGKYFASEIGEMFRRMEDATAQITAPTEASPKIKILIHARSKWITELIVEYASMEQSNNFIISNEYADKVIDDFDIIIDEPDEKYVCWEHFVLSVERICVKRASNSSLAGKELYFQQLRDEPFILPSVGNGMRKRYENACKRHKIKEQIIVECNDRQCLHHYVASGLGLTIGSYHSLGDSSQQNLTALKVLDFDEIQTVCVFYKKNAYQKFYLKKFCDYLYSKRIL